MFLTIELLKEYKACPEGIGWFARHFPDGAELIDVINTRHIPITFLDWGILHLPTTEIEKQRYYELVGISTDSDKVFASHNINHSHYVTNSDNIENSSYIFFSQDITDSASIAHSNRIKESAYIQHSNAIFTSDNIVYSNNIKDSTNVSYSSYIINSRDIYKSTLLTNSGFCFLNSNLQDSAFCTRVSNSDHCLFCYNLKDAHYCIFNKPINQTTWDFIFSEYQEVFENEHLYLFEPWNKEDANAAVVINNHYQKMFASIFSKTKYINWVKNLPYYDSLAAYEITFQPTFLQ